MDNEFKYFILAKKLNDHFREDLIKCRARFRGSLNSISFISLSCDKPQIGFKCSYNKLMDLETVNIQEYCAMLNQRPYPGRPTPEKSLQSFIIYEAERNGHFPFDPSIRLVTDEFARQSNGSKLVVDLFGFNTETNSIVVIELKSSRALTQLKAQLANAEELINEDPYFYHTFFQTHGFEWQEPYTIEKVAIWPPAQTHDRKMFPDDIREFSYRKKADSCGYELTEN